MVKLIFFQMPKVFFALPRAVARSVASQSTVAVEGAELPAGTGRLSDAQSDAERDAMTAAIAAHDPGFVVDDLVARAGDIYDLVVGSITEGDAGVARLAMADGLWETHRMVVSVRADNGIERRGSVSLVNAQLVEAYHSTLIDEVRVRLHCRGVCCDAHAVTGLVLRGSMTETEWQEDLTFTRSAAATTPAGGGILSRNCPNCGAPIRVSDDGACLQCAALVMSGRHDWVLTGVGRDPW